MSLISNAKEIADLIKKLDDVELYRKIIELEGEIIEVTREKHTLDERVQELTNTLNIKENMTFRQPFYYQEGDNVPFCPRCWETDNKSVHVVNGGQFHAGTRHTCPSCNTIIHV